MRGSAAVILLSTSLDDARLARWVTELSARYGDVRPRRANDQVTWQWVRRSRMIRVTTRPEPGTGRRVSVSLVDGPLLDGLSESPA